MTEENGERIKLSLQKNSVFVKYFGGLGNQLFQYNFAHYLEVVYGFRVGMVRSRHVARSDRQPLLDELIEYSGSRFFYPPLSRSFPAGSIFSSIANRLDRLGFSCLDYNHPWQVPVLSDSLSGRIQCHLGYFQNSSLVDTAFREYSDSLLGFLEDKAVGVRERLNLDESETLVHVRRGDSLKHENRCMGRLGSDYYLGALEIYKNRSAPPVVITDDIFNSRKIADSLGSHRVVGPQDCSPWEALALFATSKTLVSANSTLSWWGAYLAIQRGNQAAMPGQWFRDCIPPTGDSLLIEGTDIVSSNFETD